MSDQDLALSKITINGQEYDADEAQSLIDLGNRTREAETKYNTSLEKVWPDYNKSQQEKARLEKELEEAKTQLTEFSTKKQDGTETSSDVKQAREAAKKLGLVFEDELKSNPEFVRKSDLDKYYDERDKNKQAVQEVLQSADKLEKDINGSDGRPTFNKKVVLAYASAYGFSDLNAAYEDMNAEQLKAWKDAQVATQRARSLKTQGGGGKKEPETPRVNDSNFKQLLNEALYPSGE